MKQKTDNIYSIYILYKALDSFGFMYHHVPEYIYIYIMFISNHQ